MLLFPNQSLAGSYTISALPIKKNFLVLFQVEMNFSREPCVWLVILSLFQDTCTMPLNNFICSSLAFSDSAMSCRYGECCMQLIVTALYFIFILSYILDYAQHFIVGFSFWPLLDFKLVLIENCPWWFWNVSLLSGTSPIKGFHVSKTEQRA